MKKVYKSPSVVITAIAPHEIMATSMLLNRGEQDDYEIMDESELLSRSHNSIWEDEDDE